jgi:Cd2+/Zn2+-exporting ATPase
MVSALTSAARNGVLIKGAEYIEEIRLAKVVVFDKTGTLTKGKPEVTDIISLNNYSKDELLQIAASMESKSKHPLAQAIINKAKESKIKLKRISNFVSVTGKGLKGKIGAKKFYIGNKSFFDKLNLKYSTDILHKLQNEGKTVVLVGNDKHVIGIIALMDTIRESSEDIIAELKNQGIRTVMLTGDNHRTAVTISNKLNMDEFHADLLPEDKVTKVEELLKEHEHVIMVGDGVNDAPALAKAHVGIAMGAAGSDVAIETADIALMEDDLSKVSYLINLSKRTMTVVRQNIVASILIKGSFAIFTIPGFISLWLAVAIGDMGLSLAVIVNALRIGKRK